MVWVFLAVEVSVEALSVLRGGVAGPTSNPPPLSRLITGEVSSGKLSGLVSLSFFQN